MCNWLYIVSLLVWGQESSPALAPLKTHTLLSGACLALIHDIDIVSWSTDTEVLPQR